jgi:hypothetical protein
VRWRGLALAVAVERDRVTYELLDGEGATLAFQHAGEDVTVTVGEPLVLPVRRRAPLLPRPQQPPGRAPADRRTGA